MRQNYVRKILVDIPRHHKRFHARIASQYHQIMDSSEEITKKIITAYNGLREIGEPAKNSSLYFVFCLIEAIALGKLKVFTMNSHALTPGSEVLREKPQYRKNRHLYKKMHSLVEQIGIELEYKCILPDVDNLFPISHYAALWDANLALLERESELPAMRLSTIASDLHIQQRRVIETHRKYPELQTLSANFSSDLIRLIDFNASPDFVDNQVHSYATVGLVLELVLPFYVLLDVQKKRYPFEQPLYNFFRNDTLPIVYCGQG